MNGSTGGKRTSGRVDQAARPTTANTPTGTDVDLKAEEQPVGTAEDQAVAAEAVAQAEAAEPAAPAKCADCGARNIAVTTDGVAGEKTSYCNKCRPANLRS